jgi:enoyl-CoA hydratase/carnithine racemase
MSTSPRSRSTPPKPLEVGVGATPGAGGVQHLGRLLGRGRAMEAILAADDFSAELAERYGWINRALPDAELDAFVARLARRIASFPADAVRTAKRVLNELMRHWISSKRLHTFQHLLVALLCSHGQIADQRLRCYRR